MAKRKTIISWSPLRAVMKKAGAEIVGKDAIWLLMNYLENKAKLITENALVLAKHSKRKKITGDDVTLAISTINPEKVKSRID